MTISTWFLLSRRITNIPQTVCKKTLTHHWQNAKTLEMVSWPQPWLWAGAQLWTAAAWTPWCSSSPLSRCCHADERGQTPSWLLSVPYCYCQTQLEDFPQTVGGEDAPTVRHSNTIYTSLLRLFLPAQLSWSELHAVISHCKVAFQQRHSISTGENFHCISSVETDY